METNITDSAGDWITIKEAAALLGVHHITLRRWIKAGKIKATWEYEGEQGKRLISRDQVIELLKEQGKTDPETGPPARIEDNQLALNINTGIANIKHLLNQDQEERKKELKNVKAAISVKLFISMGLVLIVGIAIALYIAYIAGVKHEAGQKALKGAMFKQFAYLQETQNKDQEATREKIEAVRADTKSENQATGEILSQQSKDILRTGDQVKAQADKIEQQTAEIKELKAQLMELQAGIAALNEKIILPTPTPDTAEEIERRKRDRAIQTLWDILL